MTTKNSAPKTNAAVKPAKAPKAVAQAAPAKVGKLDKAAKADKPAKAPRAPKGEGQGQAGQRAPRGQYAGKRITVTAEGKAANLRGNRAERWAIVSAAKNVNDVLGQSFTRTDGEQGTITSSGIRNFVDRGFITLS